MNFTFQDRARPVRVGWGLCWLIVMLAACDGDPSTLDAGGTDAGRDTGASLMDAGMADALPTDGAAQDAAADDAMEALDASVRDASSADTSTEMPECGTDSRSGFRIPPSCTEARCIGDELCVRATVENIGMAEADWLECGPGYSFGGTPEFAELCSEGIFADMRSMDLCGQFAMEGVVRLFCSPRFDAVVVYHEAVMTSRTGSFVSATVAGHDFASGARASSDAADLTGRSDDLTRQRFFGVSDVEVTPTAGGTGFESQQFTAVFVGTEIAMPAVFQYLGGYRIALTP